MPFISDIDSKAIAQSFADCVFHLCCVELPEVLSEICRGKMMAETTMNTFRG